MPVTFDRNGTSVTITITFDGAPILNAPTNDARAKRVLIGQAALQILSDAVTAVSNTDAQLDAQVTDTQAAVNRIRANRPTGTL